MSLDETMRVLHLCESFSPLSETFIYRQIVELEAQGVESHVLTFRRLNEQERPFIRTLVVSPPPRWSPWRIWQRIKLLSGTDEAMTPGWPQLRKKTLELLKKDDSALIHAHFGEAGVFVLPIIPRLHLPLIVTFYGYDISARPLHPGWRSAYSELWRTARAILVLSREMRERVIELGCPSDKIHVVHLGIHADKLPFRTPTGQIQEFLSVGRLTEKKGHLDAIKAVELLVRRGWPIKLRIIGDGPLRPLLDKYIRSRKINEHIKLLGAVAAERVMREMRDSDAFLLCSKTASSGDMEGTPTVLIEAQAIGLPCIATRHAGIPEMLPEANHYLLAPEGDIPSIARNIQVLINASLREQEGIARRGRDYVFRHFNLAIETAKIRSVYENVLHTSVRPS